MTFILQRQGGGGSNLGFASKESDGFAPTLSFAVAAVPEPASVAIYSPQLEFTVTSTPRVSLKLWGTPVRVPVVPEVMSRVAPGVGSTQERVAKDMAHNASANFISFSFASCAA